MTLYRSYFFPWAFRLNWYRKAWTSLWYLIAKIPVLKSLVRFILVLLFLYLDDLVLPPSIDEVLVRFL